MMGCRQIHGLKQFTGFKLSVKSCFDGIKNQIQFPPIRKSVTILLCFIKVLHVRNVGVVTCQHDIWKKFLRHNNSEESFNGVGVENPAFILQMSMASIILYFLDAIWLLPHVSRIQVAFIEVCEQRGAAQTWCFQDTAIAQWSQHCAAAGLGEEWCGLSSLHGK